MRRGDVEERCTALIKRACVNDHEDRQPMKDYFQRCDSLLET